MAEHPIAFTVESFEKVLRGEKTQARGVLKYHEDGSFGRPRYKVGDLLYLDNEPGAHPWRGRITAVRCERVQEISEANCLAEGVSSRPDCTGYRLHQPGWSADWSIVGTY